MCRGRHGFWRMKQSETGIGKPLEGSLYCIWSVRDVVRTVRGMGMTQSRGERRKHNYPSSRGRRGDRWRFGNRGGSRQRQLPSSHRLYCSLDGPGYGDDAIKGVEKKKPLPLFFNSVKGLMMDRERMLGHPAMPGSAIEGEAGKGNSVQVIACIVLWSARGEDAVRTRGAPLSLLSNTANGFVASQTVKTQGFFQGRHPRHPRHPRAPQARGALLTIERAPCGIVKSVGIFYRRC